jgi:hypothetical protein
LAGIEVLELSLTDPIAQPAQRQTLFRPSDVELRVNRTKVRKVS